MRRTKKIQHEKWNPEDTRRMKALILEARRVYKKAQELLDALEAKKLAGLIKRS